MPALDPAAVAAATIGDSTYGLLIGGEWSQAGGGRSFPVDNPATGAELASVPDAGPQETRAAIDAAAAAFPATRRSGRPCCAAVLG
jgi:succinate-semialdehyde dehydrogenase/glutarate-semialdehyde dehydrogenase